MSGQIKAHNMRFDLVKLQDAILAHAGGSEGIGTIVKKQRKTG